MDVFEIIARTVFLFGIIDRLFCQILGIGCTRMVFVICVIARMVLGFAATIMLISVT